MNFDIIEAMGVKPKEQKSKVAIVRRSLELPTSWEVLVLTRSHEEHTRPGGPDWPGGKFDPDEDDPLEVLYREAREEMPGTNLLDPLSIYERHKTKAGSVVISHLFAATAEIPYNIDGSIPLSNEHSGHQWVSEADFGDAGMPDKYQTALIVGRPAIRQLLDISDSAIPAHSGADYASHAPVLMAA